MFTAPTVRQCDDSSSANFYVKVIILFVNICGVTSSYLHHPTTRDLDPDLGSIEPGIRADLLLLSQNPLQQVSA
jgi:hypothetical protein